MIAKLLLIADDFSGALDAGVKFSIRGVETTVVVDNTFSFEDIHTEVVIVNTDSRHMPPEQAARAVKEIVVKADQAGVAYIFKKTDSVLRGNIGTELNAVLEGMKANRLTYFPSYPEMNRIVRGGNMYYNGALVHESALGNDPFEPLNCSNVKNIICRQANVAVENVASDEEEAQYAKEHKTIVVYDSENNESIERAVRRLKEHNELRLIAGCAAVVPAILDCIEFKRHEVVSPATKGNMVVLCGSVNPIMRGQIEYARKNGSYVEVLTREQQFDVDFVGSREFREMIDRLWEKMTRKQLVIIASNPEILQNDFAENSTMKLDVQRQQVSYTLSSVLKALLDRGMNRAMFISGGDVAACFIRMIGCRELHLLGEIASSTVLLDFEYRGAYCQMITKSGGFGEDSLLLDVMQYLRVNNTETGR